MRIVDKGVVFAGRAGTRTASCCFPAMLPLGGGRLLAAWRVGSEKDSADGTIWISRSADGGRSWSQPAEPFARTFEGTPGDLHACWLTDLGGGRILAALMWFDRSRPHLPMFNPKTEGLLPARTLFSLSRDGGRTWSGLWAMDDEPYRAPMTITGPVLVLPDGCWACQFEVNKPYEDTGPWQQAAALKFSRDEGRTWAECVEVARDPTMRVRYWDQRHAVAPDGTCVAMFWTYDPARRRDLPISSGRSYDAGRTWEPPRDTGVAGTHAYPATLTDGRLLIVYVDRYATRSLRLAVSEDQGRSFEPIDDPLYVQPAGRRDPGSESATGGENLQDQQLWTFGIPSAVATPEGDVWATHYAGDARATRVHWARLRLDG